MSKYKSEKQILPNPEIELNPVSLSDIRKSLGTNTKDILKIDKKFESEEMKAQQEILKAIESEEEINPFDEEFVPKNMPR